MSKHKRQHYIPASYLRPWCDPNAPSNQTPYVWLISKDGSSVTRKSPEKIFRQSDMYTIRGADGSRLLHLEHGLGQLESDYCHLRDNKLLKQEPLSAREHVSLCGYVAALHCRTKSYMENQRNQWLKVKEMGDRMMEWAETASHEQKIHASMLSPSESKRGMSYEDICELVKNPVQNLLLPMMESQMPSLLEMSKSVLFTDLPLGFVTSDAPCVWFDPEASSRPPLHRGPGLAYQTTEIRLPISPQCMLILNSHGIEGWSHINSAKILDEINSLTKAYCDECFVTNCKP